MCFVFGKNVMFLSSSNSPEHAFKVYNNVAFYTEIFLVLIIDELTTKYILDESYDGYPKYFLFPPSHKNTVNEPGLLMTKEKNQDS